MKIRFLPFALSLSKGHLWFNKPALSEAGGLITNDGAYNAYFHPPCADGKLVWTILRLLYAVLICIGNMVEN